MEPSSSSKSKSKKQPTRLPRHRLRNRLVALSVKEARKVAETLRPNSSARRQIQSSPEIPEPHKLPEKYEILAQFFDSLVSSIRLLRLKGSSSSFTNICPKIKCLTDRRFTHRHLAQLKFILRGAIEIKRVLVFDERTSCMKPDLHVSINVDAVENDGKLKSESGNMRLRKVLRSLLADFSKSCPEVDEIPEELLPEPFNRKKLDVHSNMKTPTSSFPIKTSTVALTALQSAASETCIRDDETAEGTEQDLNSNINNSPNVSFPLGTSIEAHRKQQPVVASHLSQSFRKRFSQNVISHEVQNYPLNLSKTDLQSSVLPIPESPLNKSSSKEKSSSAAGAPSLSKLSFESTSNEKCLAVHTSPAHLPQSCPLATPSKEIDAMNNENGSPAEIANIHSTPAEHILIPAGLMNVPPKLYPPKRYMSPKDDYTSSSNKLIRRPPCSRLLKFDTPIKNGNVGDEMDDTGGVSVDNDVFDILPENILQSVDEIPEELLPEPFNPKKLDVHSNMKTPTSSFPIKTSTVALTALQSAVSETCIRDDETAEGTEQDLNSNINNSSNVSFPLGTSIEAHRKQQPVVASHLSRSFCKRFSQKVISHEVQNYPLNLSMTDFQSSVLPVPEIANIHSTPANNVLTPAGLMNVMPTLYPPKRCYMSPEDDSTSPPNKLIRRPSCSRSLKFDTPIKNGNVGDENILPSIIENERKAVEERNPTISRAKRRQQMITSLPKLFISTKKESG